MDYIQFHLDDQTKLVLWERYPEVRGHLASRGLKGATMPVDKARKLRNRMQDDLRIPGLPRKADEALRFAIGTLTTGVDESNARMAERRKHDRAQKRSQGLVPVEVWVPAPHRDRIHAYAKQLCGTK